MSKIEKITLYGLSTCPYCRKEKEFLEGKKLRFEAIMLNLVDEDEKKILIEVVREHNPRLSFPTLVIVKVEQKPKVYIGFDDQIAKDISQCLAAV